MGDIVLRVQYGLVVNRSIITLGLLDISGDEIVVII